MTSGTQDRPAAGRRASPLACWKPWLSRKSEQVFHWCDGRQQAELVELPHQVRGRS